MSENPQTELTVESDGEQMRFTSLYSIEYVINFIYKEMRDGKIASVHVSITMKRDETKE